MLSLYRSRRHWQRKNLSRDATLLKLAARNRTTSEPVVHPDGPIVSLTSYSTRIDSVYFTLETIGRNSLRPRRLILWLDETARLSTLPSELRRLQKRGLEVLPCRNYGSHKKYYPFLESQSEFAVPLVTADDDMLYPRDWLAGLNAAYQANDHVINCFRARTVRVADGAMAPYETWPLCTSSSPSFRTFATGSSGAIFPPRYLAALKTAGESFMQSCPKADDLWLHVNALRSGHKIRQITAASQHYPHIPGTQDIALFRTNMVGGGNDIQIANTYQAADVATLVNAA